MEARVSEWAPAPSATVIRPLRAEDLEPLFGTREFEVGAEWLARQERGELYVAVAEVGGVPVGRRCLDFTINPRRWIGFAFAAAVLPEWRSRGIGSKLDEHMEQVARANGFYAIRCSVAKRNTRARTWHDRLGYRCIGESVGRWTEASGREVEVECWKLQRTFGLRGRVLTSRLVVGVWWLARHSRRGRHL